MPQLIVGRVADAEEREAGLGADRAVAAPMKPATIKDIMFGMISRKMMRGSAVAGEDGGGDVVARRAG